MSPPPTLLPRPSRVTLVRYWLTDTFSGRAVASGLIVKAFAFLLAIVLGRAPWIDVIDTIGDLALMLGALIVGVRLFVDLKSQLLWRVRRKLTLSYIFIGFVPAFLIIIFFLVAGLVVFFNVAGYMMAAELEHAVEQARFVAESTARALTPATSPADAMALLKSSDSMETLSKQYPGASIALVPSRRTCADAARVGHPPVAAGAWAHMPAPSFVPPWVPCAGRASLVSYVDRDRTRLTARAVARPEGANDALVVDVPIGDSFARQLISRTGISLLSLDPYDPDETLSDVREGGQERFLTLGPANILMDDERGRRVQWVTFIDSVNWEDGANATLVVRFVASVRDIYERVAPVSIARVGDFTFSQVLLIALAVIGGLFFIILVVAFSMGLALARSITGSVHDLFAGTMRVRRGDFSGRVHIRSRDQLGELAQSFNSMTSSIEDLLHQKAEKERLEQELRIARSIQMSLLPQGPLTMPGLTLTAHCEPAREVGGDYYDFLPIDEYTLGVLVADVSGKGTSAALYMAELKGIVLSLSQRHRSPRDLLIEADRIISRHLDSRSFITVTYLVIDLKAGTLAYARAGHYPLVYVPGPYAAQRTPKLLAPDGLVLGLQLDEGRTFARLLEEVTVPLGRGDLFVLYTDGVTEAMNADGDCFGDARLAALIAQHADLSADELRERILRDVDAFTASAVQQDDMTMVLLRVEQVGQQLIAPAAAHADA